MRNFTVVDDDLARLAVLERRLSRQKRKSRRTLLSAIDSLVRMVEARDPYIAGHSLRVCRYAVGLAETMQLPAAERRRLSLAAKLHDIGKVGLPEQILNKPAPLSKEEFEAVKEHPLIGERILTPIIRSKIVLAAIRGHHERMDGAGYPDGLQGQQIPLLARILSIADCYDALTSSRAYRVPMASAAALDTLREAAGTQFDAELVRLFVERFAG